MTKETGGSAFPGFNIIGSYGDYSQSPYDGMTLRDYFAAKAISGLIAAHTELIGHGGRIDPRASAQYSYELADAMIEARKS